MEIVEILIADDHELILNGIKDMLRPFKQYRIVGKATNGKEAIEQAIKYRPDVIFMDISMPVINGIEATKAIIKKLPETKILALTQHEENEYVIQILKAGGSGYLLKNSKKDEFIEAIQTVLSGKKYFSKTISEQMLDSLLNIDTEKKEQEDVEILLTKRE